MKFTVQSYFILLVCCFGMVLPACIFDDRGLCMHECPPDTVTYVSPCGGGETVSQRTCEEPEPRSLGQICDLSRCDCVEPQVWDETAKKCVLLEQCTKNAPDDEKTSQPDRERH